MQHLIIILFCISLLLMNYIFLCVKHLYFLLCKWLFTLSTYLLESVFWALICMSFLLKTLVLRLSFAVNLLLKFPPSFISTFQFFSICLSFNTCLSQLFEQKFLFYGDNSFFSLYGIFLLLFILESPSYCGQS